MIILMICGLTGYLSVGKIDAKGGMNVVAKCGRIDIGNYPGI
jgi:hypothetical protein